VRFRFDILNKVDWNRLRENKHLKLYIGLAVILIVLLIFSLEIYLSIRNFRKTILVKEVVMEKGTFEEIYEPEILPAATPEIKPKKFRKAKIAIILDDAGGTVPDYHDIYSIKEPLTISIIPDLPTSSRVAKQAKDAGLEIMLHMPMEALNGDFTRQYGGMITTDQTSEEIKKIVIDDFSSVKLAIGFNNHMGSKATSDERVMDTVFSSIDRGKYFVDSKTSKDSVAIKLAKKHRIRSGENNVFLDGVTNESEIEYRFKMLIAKARNNGTAIGIGHATRPATIAVLKHLMPLYARKGIKFVHVSEIVK